MKTTTPHISVNKLAEFTGATQSRKKGILKTIKSSSVEDFTRRITYSAAKSAFKSFMVDQLHDLKIFELKRNELLSVKVDSEFKKRDIINSLLAIKALEKSSKQLLSPYFKLKARRGFPRGTQNIVVGGVLVHLAPDIAFFKEHKDKIIGAIKLIFSKNRPITPMEGQIVAGLTYRYIKRKFKTEIVPENCFAFDVFSKKIFVAPDSFRYHELRLRKSYIEINNLWKKIEG